jgi:sulfide dehydrogenase cytochrome subunit
MIAAAHESKGGTLIMTVRHPLRPARLLPALMLVAGTLGADPLIKSCDQCHAPEQRDVPVISGVSAYYLEYALQSYLEHTRVARKLDQDDMKTIVGKLSAADMKRILEVYPARPFTPIRQQVDPARVALGEQLHRTQCEKCHTENGAQAEDDSGVLAGQWKDWLLEEMKHYRDGTRGGDRKMIEAFKPMSDTQLEALAHFYAAQQ